MINGKQCTIFWYVDDNNLYHADPTLVIALLEQFNTLLGDLVVNRVLNILSLELISPYAIIRRLIYR